MERGERMNKIEEILADPICRDECNDDKHYAWNVLRWALLLADAASYAMMDSPPRTGMTPERLGTTTPSEQG